MREIDNTMRGKILIRLRVTPVQGDTTRHFGMENLFSNVPTALTVLRTECESVLCEKGMLGQVSAAPTRVEKSQRATDIVVECSPTIYFLVRMKGLVGLITKRLGRIANHKGAELGSVGKRDGMRMCGKMKRETDGIVRGGWRKRTAIRKPVNKCHPRRKTKMARVGRVRGREEIEGKRIRIHASRERPVFGREIDLG